MFTGIVEELGEVRALEWRGDAGILSVRGSVVTADTRPGDSVAVNGVCLTVVELADATFTADVMKETFDHSALGSLGPGDPVNLERAVTLATRLGGHVVQGHVDGVGVILSRQRGPRWDDLRVGLPPGLDRYIVHKGSITVDGVSLTVTDVDSESFSVSLIPATCALTTLGRKGVGALVNLEVDVLAKYLEKLVEGAHP
jgi:riboflavin synthase